MSDYGRQVSAAVARSFALRRQVLGLSLEALAQSTGLHRTSIGLIERGKRGVTLESAAAIARALDLSLADVVAVAEQETGGVNRQ